MKPLLGSGCRGSGLFFLVQVLILLRRRMAAQNNGGPAYAAAVAAAPGVSRQAPEVFGTPPCSPTRTLPRRSAQPSPSNGIALALAVAFVGEQRLPSSRWLRDEPTGMGPFVTWGCPEQWQRRLHRLRQRATVLLLLLPQPPRTADTLEGRSHSAQPQARRVCNPPTPQPSVSQPSS